MPQEKQIAKEEQQRRKEAIESATVSVQPEQLQEKPSELDRLISSITPDNIHAEVDFGGAVGKEFPQEGSSSNVSDENYESKK